MRTRIRWAWYCVLACSALWGVVVCLYCVGRDRETKRVVQRLDSQSEFLSNLAVRVVSVENRSVSFSPESGAFSPLPTTTTFKPRILGVGQTHSPKFDYIYLDIQYGSNDVRRSYKRVGPRNEAGKMP